MKLFTKALIAGLVLTGVGLVPLPAMSEEVIAARNGDLCDLSDAGTALSVGELRNETGRQDISDSLIQLSDMKVNGSVASNYLQSASTGTNAISQDSFSNLNGIATVIQNTGNQVLIQNSMILNLTMK